MTQDIREAIDSKLPMRFVMTPVSKSPKKGDRNGYALKISQEHIDIRPRPGVFKDRDICVDYMFFAIKSTNIEFSISISIKTTSVAQTEKCIVALKEINAAFAELGIKEGCGNKARFIWKKLVEKDKLKSFLTDIFAKLDKLKLI